MFLHLTVCDETIDKNLDLSSSKANQDQFQIAGKALYLKLASGCSKTPFQTQFIEKKVGATCTTRNWKSFLKLHAIIQQS